MNFNKIPDVSRGKIEQVCERFAVMVYEVLCGKMAAGLNSVTYSYEGAEDDHCKFTAQFTDFDAGNGAATTITFNIRRYTNEQLSFPPKEDPRHNRFYLYDGRVEDSRYKPESECLVHFSNLSPILISIRAYRVFSSDSMATYFWGSSYSDRKSFCGYLRDLQRHLMTTVSQSDEFTI